MRESNKVAASILLCLCCFQANLAYTTPFTLKKCSVGTKTLKKSKNWNTFTSTPKKHVIIEKENSRTKLRTKRNPAPDESNNDKGKKKRNLNKKVSHNSIFDITKIQDRDLLAGDLLSLLLVAQLLGFTDAVLDPLFLPNGGFAAPIPVIPSTLGTMTTRLSGMDVAWILASLKSKGYNEEAIADDESALKCGLTIWLDHCSIRIIFALFLAFLSHSQVDGFDLLRQFWFTLPVMLSFRLIYCRRRTGRL